MFVIADRVKEASVTTGTGNIVLAGAYGGFQTFLDAIGDGNSTYYAIENDVRWEVGIGTYNAGGNYLSRDTVFVSSNGGGKISLAGVSTVFCTLPADRGVFEVPEGSISGAQFIGTTIFKEDVIVSGATTFDDGFVTFIRPNSEGNFFHAYKDDGTNKTISLHINEQISDPLFKFGLKQNPLDESEEPNYSYLFGRESTAGILNDSGNYFQIGAGFGFAVTSNYNNVFIASSDDGVTIQPNNILNPSLTVVQSLGSTQDIQQWTSSDTTIYSVVDDIGQFGVLISNPLYPLHVANSGKIGDMIFSSGIYFADGTFQDTAATGIADTATSGWAAYTINAGDQAVSGWAQYNFDNFTGGDATAISGWADYSIVNVSGWAKYYVDSQDHSSLAVSGWSSYNDTAISGWADYNFSNLDTTSISGWADYTMTQRDTEVSGWARYYVDSQDHSSLAVSGWAQYNFDNLDLTSISGWADYNFATSGDVLAISGWANYSDVNISGWARAYVDSQDHSAAAVSGWADYTMTDRDSAISGYLENYVDSQDHSTTTFDNDLTVSLGGGKTFGRYEDGDVIPASGLTAPEVISLAVTEPIDPTVNLSSSSSVDFNQTSVSVTLNFNHTINSLGASVASASLEFRRANTGSWTVLSTSTTTPDSFVHSFTDTAFNTDQLNYRYIVTDSVGATATATFNINPDTYSAPSISFNVDAPSLSGPESDLSRERGNDESDLINGNVSRNETYVDIQTAQWQYRADGGAWQDIDTAISLPAAGGSLSTKNHLPSETTASTIQYRIEVVDDYQTTYSSTITVNFGLLIFYGPSSSTPATSANVRALPDRLFTVGNDTFNLNTGSTEVNFTVAIPDTETISEVLDLDALNANITAEYINNPFGVDDGGGTSVDYNVYTMTIAIPYSSNHRHQVTKG